MKGQGPKFTAKTWQKLMTLGQKQGAVKLSRLAAELELAEEETLALLRQTPAMGITSEVYHQNNESWVDIDANSAQYILSLTPLEWVELQHLLSSSTSTSSIDKKNVSFLRKKVSDNGPIKVVMELLNQLELWDQHFSEKQNEIISILDLAVKEMHLVQVVTAENKKYLVHPCRVLHLEGQLSLVAEDTQDRCLVVIDISELTAASKVDSTSSLRVTAFEVEEFISAIRSMNEKEARLILKIHDHQSVNLFPDHQFLGKPCMITNSNGDLIWAAYVEPCQALFDWLMGLGKNVEILDPVKFKQDYLAYCEEKLSKIA